MSRYLHFTDNTTLPARDEPGYHRLQKVLPIVDHVRQRFLEAYRPNVQNSIDEAVIPFKGKLCIIYSMYDLYMLCIHTARVVLCCVVLPCLVLCCVVLPCLVLCCLVLCCLVLCD